MFHILNFRKSHSLVQRKPLIKINFLELYNLMCVDFKDGLLNERNKFFHTKPVDMQCTFLHIDWLCMKKFISFI